MRNIIMYTLSSILQLSLLGCGANQVCNPNAKADFEPSHELLPDIFDPTSVRGIEIKTLDLNNNELPALSRSKIGGHVYYKVKLTNPNHFGLTLTNLHLEHSEAYLFYANHAADNCFNNKLYHSDGSGVQLSFAAGESCAFYTLSPWIERYTNQSGASNLKQTDYWNYTATALGFGFSLVGNIRRNMWCQYNCRYPFLPLNYDIRDSSHHAITSSYTLRKLSSKVDPNLEPSSFLLSGDRLAEMQVDGNTRILSINYTKIAYNEAQHDLEILNRHQIPIPIYDNTYNHLEQAWPPVFNRDGSLVVIPARISGYFSRVVATPGRSRALVHPQFDGALTIGLDNRIYQLREHNKFLYAFEHRDLEGLLFFKQSSGLPIRGTIIGVDQDSNMVILSPERIASCYMQQSSNLPQRIYNSTPALHEAADLNQQQLISVHSLYTKYMLTPETFYNLNHEQVANPFIYPFAISSCQSLPAGLIAPQYPTIITEKYTVVKTPTGYYFVAPEETSTGENDALLPT